MKIPKKLNILGHTYTIEFRNREKDDTVFQTGACNLHYNKIVIDKHQCQQSKESTLIHEIIEAINYHQQLDLEHNKICLLETGIYQVLKDNNFLN